MSLNSREKREREQRKRMARGRRNLTQLVGSQAQGQRTPMNRGSGSVSTVEAPKFRQSTAADDITQAGLAYKGGKGLFDFTQGKEAYIDKAGNAIKAVEPWTIGGENIGGRLSQMGEGISNFGQNLWNMEPGVAVGKSGELTSSMFGAPWEPLNMGGGGGLGSGLSSSTSPFISTTGGSSSGLLAPEVAQAAQAGSPEYFQGLTGLQTPANATEAALEAGAGTDMMGAAGSALGMGLNAYDMSQQGVTAGNALGLGGSAVLGLNAMGMANAWNPAGWAMLGAGTLGSLFDWW
jgi:hypothetical protein